MCKEQTLGCNVSTAITNYYCVLTYQIACLMPRFPVPAYIYISVKMCSLIQMIKSSDCSVLATALLWIVFAGNLHRAPDGPSCRSYRW